ncbi:MAG: BsuBI/PstI family type II restriction endonuclease [Saprospiraceae bacterium]
MHYLGNSKKSSPVVRLIEQAIAVLDAIGIPVEGKTSRGLEKMAMAFLAVAGVKKSWQEAQGLTEGRILKTREIIAFINANFEENISSGSYDDIRRKDLKLPILAGLVIKAAANPKAATNDPTRGYALTSELVLLLRQFDTDRWSAQLSRFTELHSNLRSELNRTRAFEKVAVTLPDGVNLSFSPGQHNLLQKQIIEEFLPRFGRGCRVLYVGDTANKFLLMDRATLDSLRFFELLHDELPDIIAYDASSNWLFLIEAVHSSGTISEVRMLELKRLTQVCTAEIVFVTAFLSKNDFRKWAADIAWETEVWIADNPDHLIHFNGDKFLGPHKF